MTERSYIQTNQMVHRVGIDEKKSILIIDDQPNNLKLISTLLDGKYNVIIANSGQKGLKTIEKKIPDLILLDINMPEMNGFQVCDILKKDERTKNIPIVFLTANTDFDSIAKGFDVGAIDYITKPFNSKEVLVRINTQIQLSESIYTIKAQNEELIKAKEELEKSNNEKDRLFSIIAHDLRSPFQGFMGITKLFVDENMDVFSKEELNEIFTSLNQNSHKIYELLENLLQWASLKRNVSNFQPIKINIHKIIKANSEIFQLNANQKNIEIKVEEIDPHISVFADEEMLNSILRNLISNSIKFSNRNSVIELTANEITTGMVRISVKDSGIGIPEKHLPNLFSIDKKLNRTGTEGEPSSGLGLVLCKDFVEKNGGQIEVESEVGKGTMFTLIFPKYSN